MTENLLPIEINETHLDNGMDETPRLMGLMKPLGIYETP